jgi:BolA protein
MINSPSDRSSLEPSASAAGRPSADEVAARIRNKLAPSSLEVIDESHLHAGHAGASGGAGHYRVRIASAAFIGRSLLACHRLVYDPLADWMPHRIHALAIEIDRSQG